MKPKDVLFLASVTGVAFGLSACGGAAPSAPDAQIIPFRTATSRKETPPERPQSILTMKPETEIRNSRLLIEDRLKRQLNPNLTAEIKQAFEDYGNKFGYVVPYIVFRSADQIGSVTTPNGTLDFLQTNDGQEIYLDTNAIQRFLFRYPNISRNEALRSIALHSLTLANVEPRTQAELQEIIPLGTNPSGRAASIRPLKGFCVELRIEGEPNKEECRQENGPADRIGADFGSPQKPYLIFSDLFIGWELLAQSSTPNPEDVQKLAKLFQKSDYKGYVSLMLGVPKEQLTKDHYNYFMDLIFNIYTARDIFQMQAIINRFVDDKKNNRLIAPPPTPTPTPQRAEAMQSESIAYLKGLGFTTPKRI